MRRESEEEKTATLLHVETNTERLHPAVSTPLHPVLRCQCDMNVSRLSVVILNQIEDGQGSKCEETLSAAM